MRGTDVTHVLCEGDRVQIGSLWAVRPRPWHPGVVATGVIDRFTVSSSRAFRGQIRGVVVRLPGGDYCTASPDELTKLT